MKKQHSGKAWLRFWMNQPFPRRFWLYLTSGIDYKGSLIDHVYGLIDCIVEVAKAIGKTLLSIGAIIVVTVFAPVVIVAKYRSTLKWARGRFAAPEPKPEGEGK